MGIFTTFTCFQTLRPRKRGFLHETGVVYHLLGKTGWSTVEVNGTHQIPKGNFHGDALVPFTTFLGIEEIIERAWNALAINIQIKTRVVQIRSIDFIKQASFYTFGGL